MKNILFLILLIVVSSAIIFAGYKSINIQPNNNNQFGMKDAKLTKEEIISLAEEFIKNNGYTNHKVNQDFELTYESLEFYSDKEEMLKNRFNTLKPKAIGAKLNNGQWTIGFEYTDRIKEKYPDSGKKTGRAVTMDVNGNNVKIQHEDLFLDWLEE